MNLLRYRRTSVPASLDDAAATAVARCAVLARDDLFDWLAIDSFSPDAIAGGTSEED